MEESRKEIDLIELFKHIWVRRKALLKWCIVGMVTGIVIAYSIPREYECVVRLAPEKANQSMGGLRGMSDMAAMVGINVGTGNNTGGLNEMVYPEILRSTPFMSQFANIPVEVDGAKTTLMEYLDKDQKKAWWSYLFAAPGKVLGWLLGSDSESQAQYNPYKPDKETRAFYEALSQRISASTDKKTDLISVRVMMQDPMVAAVVADSVVNKLQEFMIQYQTSKARHDLNNSQMLLQKAKAEYDIAMSELAKAQDQNRNLVSRSAMIHVDNLSNKRNLAYNLYQQLASQVELSKLKVQEDTPVVTVLDPPMAPNRTKSPRKMVIMAGFIFLFGVGYAGFIIVKEFLKKEEVI